MLRSGRGTVCKALGAVALLEQMCHLGVTFELSKAHARSSVSLPEDQDAALSYGSVPCFPP